MNRTSPHYLGDDVAVCRNEDEQRERHWPLPWTLLVLVASTALWALIVSGIRWSLF